MPGSAMGLSLLIGTGLQESVFSRLPPLIRLFIITFGSADDPSSLTLFSPKMVWVTELLRMPLIPADTTEESGVAIVFLEDGDVDTASVDDILESEVSLALGGEEDICGDAGWGKFRMDPHNLPILFAGGLFLLPPLATTGWFSTLFLALRESGTDLARAAPFGGFFGVPDLAFLVDDEEAGVAATVLGLVTVLELIL
jgi:hypothetical protein